MMNPKYIFMTYDGINAVRPENSRQITEYGYYPSIDPTILTYTNGSILFDTYRHTLYAQGMEFGYASAHPHTYQGENLGNEVLSNNGINVITGIEQNSYGTISYSYNTIYTSFSIYGYDNDYIGSYISGLDIDEQGNITYIYSEVNHINEGNLINNHATYSIVNTYLSKDGVLSYTYIDLSINASDGTYINNSTITYDNKLNVITGILQQKDGKITYTYHTLNTTHTTTGVDDGDLDNFAITYVWLDNNGNLSYKCRNQSTKAEDRLSSVKTGGNSTITLIGPDNTYTFVTQIDQAADGKIIYTYAYVNTTHSGNIVDGDFVITAGLTPEGILKGEVGKFSNSRDGDTTSGVINNVNLDHDGTLSYSFISLSNLLNINQQSLNEGTYTMQNNTAYQFITNVYQNANGSISYTYATFNTTHDGNVNGDFTYNLRLSEDGVLSGEEGFFVTEKVGDDNGVITYANLNSNGKLTYGYTNLSSGNNSGTKKTNITLQNGTTYQFITDISQAANGKISYTYAMVNTTHSTLSTTNNTNKVVTYVNLSKDGTLTYHLTDLSTTSSDKTNDGDNKKLHNDSTYQFITNISQGSDGKITYNYMKMQTSFDNEGTTNGVLTNVNIDGTGKLSYTSDNLTTSSGKYATATYTKGTKISNGASPSTYTLVLNGITQAANGKISYSYVGLYTDPINDYKYHDLMLTGHDIAIAQGNVRVISQLDIDTQGNGTSHTITYTYTHVPTREYVDGLITANDAMRYCGTFTGSAGTTLSLTPSNGDTSKGAVYKCKTACKISGKTFSVGDWIISNKDNASKTNINDGWDSFNVNITVNSSGTQNKNVTKSTYILTNIYADDTGTISYTYNDLLVTNTGTDDNGNNELLASSYDVITGVKLTQDGLTTELSYTYTTIKVNKNHHSGSIGGNFAYNITLSNDGVLSGEQGSFTTKNYGDNNGVITYVKMKSNGELSYSYTDLSVTSGTNNNTITSDVEVIVGLTQSANGKISYSYKKFAYEAMNNHHSTDNTKTGGSSKVIGAVHLSDDGILSYSYTDIAQIAYHYSPASGTTKSNRGSYISNQQSYAITSFSYNVDSNGHLMNISYSYNQFPTYNWLAANYTASYIDTLSNGAFTSGLKVATGYRGTHTSTGVSYSTYSYANVYVPYMTEDQYGVGKLSLPYKSNISFVSTYNNGYYGITREFGSTNNGRMYAYIHNATGSAYGTMKITSDYHYTPSFGDHNTKSENTIITIPWDNSESNDKIIAYTNISYDSKGHIIFSEKTPFTFKHGQVKTLGSELSNNNIVVIDANANTIPVIPHLISYTQLDVENGHITSATYCGYTFTHGTPSGGTAYNLSVPVGSYINGLTLTYNNGHITGYGFSTVPFVGEFTDEYVDFDTVSTKIYLGGKKDGSTTPSHTYIDGTTYIIDKQLYSNVSYVAQAYFNGSSYINGNRTWFAKQTYFNDGSYFNSARLYVNKVAYFDSNTYITSEHTKIQGTQTVISSGKLYLNPNSTYIGTSDGTSLTYFRTKNIDLYSDTKIEFTHLKALWGQVGS